MPPRTSDPFAAAARGSDPFGQPLVFAPGDVFRQHYIVEAFLGAGEAGQVFRVRHRFTGQRFALKVGHLGNRNNARRVARSLEEARATYQIEHENVVRVFDLACEDDGTVWQLMELLTGTTVGDMIAGHGRLTPLYAVAVAIRAAWGLQAAHEQHVIHRDVHPYNIFITSAGVVKIFDFSMAKIVGSLHQTTRRDGTMGTAAFMAPEHARKAPPSPQFDVYALGIVLWMMLTGRHPFEEHLANPFAIVAAQLHQEVPSLVTAGLPPCCDEVLRRATAKDPRDRYDGMWSFARALGDLEVQLAADPEIAELALDPPLWERTYAIAHRSDGRAQHDAAPVPRESPAPHPVPSARVVVAPAVRPKPAAPHVVAHTVPMPVVHAAAPAAAAPREPPPPLVAPPPVAVSRPATLPGPPSVPGSIRIEPAALTVRAAPPPRPRRAWALLLGGPVLLGAGVVAWLLVAPEARVAVTSPPASPPPSPSQGSSLPPSPSASPPASPPPSPTGSAKAPAPPGAGTPGDARRPPSGTRTRR